MLYRLISLVFLLHVINFSYALSADEIFILPKEKPSIFKKINKNTLNQQVILPTKKPKKKEEIKVKKKEKIEIKQQQVKIKSSFIFPKEKPESYKVVKRTQRSSEILSKKDFDKAKKVFKFIKEKKWTSALRITEKVKDKDFKNLVNWIYLKTTSNNASFSDYQKFIEKNSDYPRISRLQYLAEHKIYLKSNSPSVIINWFEKYPPVSGMGKLKLAEALQKKGNNVNIENLVKEGWTTASISKTNLSYYRSKFKKILTYDDHIKRSDYLAWETKYWDLKRMLRYLPKDERALYNARQILMSNSYGVDKSISNVPGHLKNNVGLEYDRLKWRNRRGRTEQSLEILYDNANKSEEELIRGDLWWKQRESVSRSLIYKKRYKTAYKVASEHSLTSGPHFAEAEWLSGWIALTFLKSPEYAINHFNNFYKNVGYPISLARGAYWLGKSYKILGDKINSEKFFLEGAKFLTTYYGQLSFNEVNNQKDFSLNDETFVDKNYQKEFDKNELVNHVLLLQELDATKYTKDIIKHLAKLNIEKGSEVLAAKLSTKIARYDFAIQVSKQASYQKRFYNKFNYPIITVPRKVNNKEMPKPELILAIIRQESEFDLKANSYVGARGMMQLMKYTAKLVAKQAKLPYSLSRLTEDPEYNIKLGSYYFSTLLENYNGVYPFAIAAYNAGPNRVKTWRKINGDPSKGQLSYVDWIELIRFKETRNYVQRVLENANVYKYMINGSSVKINGFVRKY